MDKITHLSDYLFLDEYCLANGDPRETKNNGCVYAIFNPHTKLTKIGYTYDYGRRLRQYVTQSGQNYILIGMGVTEIEMDAPAPFIESFLLNYYKSNKVVGEWFNLRLTQRYSLLSFLCSPNVFNDNFLDHSNEMIQSVLSI